MEKENIIKNLSYEELTKLIEETKKEIAKLQYEIDEKYNYINELLNSFENSNI